MHLNVCHVSLVFTAAWVKWLQNVMVVITVKLVVLIQTQTVTGILLKLVLVPWGIIVLMARSCLFLALTTR